MGCVVSEIKGIGCDLYLLDGNVFQNNTSTNYGASIAYYLKGHQDLNKTTVYINNTVRGYSYNTASWIYDVVNSFELNEEQSNYGDINDGHHGNSDVEVMELPSNLEEIIDNYLDYYTSENYEFEMVGSNMDQ